MRIANIDERHFYEIEAAKNDWSLSELKRQFNSSLYERLALSKDKKAVAQLAIKGQIIELPQNLIKDPYVLEFLGLSELPEYSETEFKQLFRKGASIDMKGDLYYDGNYGVFQQRRF